VTKQKYKKGDVVIRIEKHRSYDHGFHIFLWYVVGDHAINQSGGVCKVGVRFSGTIIKRDVEVGGYLSTSVYLKDLIKKLI